MDNRYRIKINEEYEKNETHIYRWKNTVKFLNSSVGNFKNGLDIGDRSPMTNILEDIYKIDFENTTVDLDLEPLSGKYDIVTSFEVIEHLFNPLFSLNEIYKVLNDNGVLYLSTPLYKPGFLWSPNHFHEMKRESIENLFKKSKFEIIRVSTFKIHPTPFYFKGLRPLLRLFFEKVQIFELKKII